MSFIIYCVVLLFTAAGALFGYDLMTSPLPTMPNVPIGHVAHMAPDKPETPAAKRADARALTPVYPAAPGGATNQASTTGAGSAQTAVKPKVEQAASTPPPARQVKNQCDVQACAATYHSFRVSDCTYQPFQGSRQLCDKTVVASIAATSKPKPPPAVPTQPAAAAPLALVPQAKTASSPRRDDASPEVARIVRTRLARTQAACNVAACAVAYSSFNAADCTYQPYDGPRRFCEK